MLFRSGKCTFGEKCRYRHEIDPDYKKKEEVVVGKNVVVNECMCLRRTLILLIIQKTLYRDDNNEFEWKYSDSYDYLKNEEIKPYNKVTIISNNVRIF